MRPIRRAAVTGLFALWLAPLAPEAKACGPDCRCAGTQEAEPACATPAAPATTPGPDAPAVQD